MKSLYSGPAHPRSQDYTLLRADDDGNGDFLDHYQGKIFPDWSGAFGGNLRIGRNENLFREVNERIEDVMVIGQIAVVFSEPIDPATDSSAGIRRPTGAARTATQPRAVKAADPTASVWSMTRTPGWRPRPSATPPAWPRCSRRAICPNDSHCGGRGA